MINWLKYHSYVKYLDFIHLNYFIQVRVLVFHVHLSIENIDVSLLYWNILQVYFKKLKEQPYPYVSNAHIKKCPRSAKSVSEKNALEKY